jgi:cyclic lactone autoinducer peptide
MKKISDVAISCIASFALRVAKNNANSCCMYVMYQAKLPETVKKLKKH